MGNTCNLCNVSKVFSTPLPEKKTTDKPIPSQIPDASTNETLPSKKEINNFEILRKLGKGAFGTIFLCREPSTKRLVAVKMLNKKKLKKVGMTKDRLMSERTVLCESRHPRVVKFFYSFQDKHYFYFVMEYLAGGCLKKYLSTCNKPSKDRVRFYAAQVLEGLLYLHREKKIIYRDLKPDNILLDEQGHAKLSDFGLAKEGMAGLTFCGTPEYIAPEILNGNSN
jgi:serine/threonine protein kinase